MSRMYHLEVYARGISLPDLLKALAEALGLGDGAVIEDYKPGMRLVFHHWLFGRETEEGAHQKIVKALRTGNPRAQVFTRWTCLDKLAYSQYGDAFDESKTRRGVIEGGKPRT